MGFAFFKQLTKNAASILSVTIVLSL
jgi:hypothetical protein